MKDKPNYKLLLFSFILAIFIFCYISFLSNAATKTDNPQKPNTLMMLSSEGDAQMLSSIIVTANNKVIVIDGGWAYDADKLVTIVKQYSDRVDYWLITHPDPDHMGALYEVLKTGAIDVGTILCALQSDVWYERYAPDIAGFVKEFKHLLFGRNVCYVKKQDVFTLDGLKIYVVNSIYDTNSDKVNNSSIVYKIISDSNSILFLGDLAHEGGQRLLAESTPYLLSANIVQMAHHGQNGVDENVYAVISPKIALWPTPEWLWTNLNGTGSYKTLVTREWMEQMGCVNYVTAYGDVVLEFD